MESQPTRDLCTERDSVGLSLLLKSELGRSLAPSAYSTHTGLDRTPPTNSSKSSWLTPTITLSVKTHVYTGSHHQSRSIVNFEASQVRERSIVDSELRDTCRTRSDQADERTRSDEIRLLCVGTANPNPFPHSSLNIRVILGSVYQQALSHMSSASRVSLARTSNFVFVGMRVCSRVSSAARISRPAGIWAFTSASFPSKAS
jgi:hypothetical protein